jgi:hypothetical protein
MPMDHVGRGPRWTSHHGWYRAPPKLGHGPLRAPGDYTDIMGGWRGGRGCSLAVRFGGRVDKRASKEGAGGGNSSSSGRRFDIEEMELRVGM